MTSHPLSSAVLSSVTEVVQAVEEGLQAESHRVGRAMGMHPAFDEKYLEKGMVRALIGSAAHAAGAGSGVSVTSLGNGGCELEKVDDGRLLRFRFKSAGHYENGGLKVTVNSDSFLTHEVTHRVTPDLFEQPPDDRPLELEQWVLAYRLHPHTLTFSGVWAAHPYRLIGDKSPYALAFDKVIELPFTPPAPAPFPKRDDDLDFGDDEKDERDDPEQGVG